MCFFSPLDDDFSYCLKLTMKKKGEKALDYSK